MRMKPVENKRLIVKVTTWTINSMDETMKTTTGIQTTVELSTHTSTHLESGREREREEVSRVARIMHTIYALLSHMHNFPHIFQFGCPK